MAIENERYETIMMELLEKTEKTVQLKPSKKGLKSQRVDFSHELWYT